MKNTEIKFLGDLQRLELKPGDRFVLTVPGPISREMAECIHAAWKDFVGGDAGRLKLLILQEGMKLGAISTEEAA